MPPCKFSNLIRKRISAFPALAASLAEDVTERQTFEDILSAARRDNKLVTVLWTAQWFSLHPAATARFDALAASFQGRAEFLICDVDSLPDLAIEFAVHDLPSVHIFHNAVLVERLPGLRSTEALPTVIQYYTTLAATDSSSTCTSSREKLDESWPASIPATSAQPKLLRSTSSCDGSSTCCTVGQATPVHRRRVSDSSATPSSASSSEHTYLPQYQQALRCHMANAERNKQSSQQSADISWTTVRFR